tara:strand:- start:47 stop:364 length:318 start_codon:yes stop_codon:yes gene_type:complete
MTLQERLKKYGELDSNQDGTLDSSELDNAKIILDLELAEEKSDAHRGMATGALAAIIVFTFLLFTPFVSIERINAISELASMFYVATASIIGAYMGVSGWMQSKR